MCKRSVGPELRDSCASSCESTCQLAVDRYVAKALQETGIVVEERERQRVAKNCSRSCRTECSKPGKVFDFVVTSRR